MGDTSKKIERIFQRGKIYSERGIGRLSVENNMIPVDCLKEDNQITVEFEGMDAIYEFTRVSDEEDKFILTWSKFDEG